MRSPSNNGWIPLSSSSNSSERRIFFASGKLSCKVDHLIPSKEMLTLNITGTLNWKTGVPVAIVPKMSARMMKAFHTVPLIVSVLIVTAAEEYVVVDVFPDDEVSM